MRYDDLVTAIADTLVRQDLNTVIPLWIKMAGDRINRDLRHWRMEKREILTADARYSSLPSDYIEATRVALVDGDTLDLVPQSRIADLINGVGSPQFFAITGGDIELFPRPSEDVEIEIAYYAAIPALSATSQTNWLSETAPEVYLYGALIHSAPYLAEDQRASIWADLYRSAIDALNAENKAARWPGRLVMRHA